MPRTLPLLALTGKTVPPNGLVIRFQRTVRPTLPSRSVAPTTATLRGEKKPCSGCRMSPRKRFADASPFSSWATAASYRPGPDHAMSRCRGALLAAELADGRALAVADAIVLLDVDEL